MTRTRRVRCKGPLCSAKPAAKALHFASTMVTLSNGKRYCAECVEEAARRLKTAQQEAAAIAQTSFEPTTPPDEVHTWTEQESREKMALLEDVPTRFVPAPTVQVNLGDPLAYTRLPSVEVEGWPLRKGRLSASSIGTFVLCPEKFRQKEIHGYREPPSGAAIAGGAAHKAVQANYLHMMMQGEPAPWKVWHEWLHAKFDNDIKRADGPIDWGKASHGEKQAFTPDDVRARAIQAAGTYLDHIAPHVHPLAVEEPFVEWVEGCPVPVVGARDVITADEVIDVKFGRVQRDLDPGWRIQGLVYLLSGDKDMAWHSVGWPKMDGTCTFHTPTDAPGLRMPCSYANYSIAGDIVRSAVSAILAYTAAFGVDNPWPGNLAHQYACDYCVFRKNETCPWWNRSIKAEDLL